jgi:hypothetical protein
MKLFAFLAFFLSLNLSAMTRQPLLSGRLYIPSGYDSNDLVEVTLIGSLPDSCHRNPTYEITREGKTFVIGLYAYYVPEERGCRKVSIPYQETINLGLLAAGSYKVQLRGTKVISEGVVRVTEASSALQDDFHYGNVMNVIENDYSRSIELVGTNPSACLVFEKLEIEIQKDIIVLKPQFEEVGVCKNGPTEFAIRYDVPHLPNHPRGVLIHVRVMGGRSFNYLFKSKV